MLQIYLPSSTDLKLYSDVPIITHDTWTIVTIFMSRHLGPNFWVLANGSKIIYQPLRHLLGPGSSHMGPLIWVWPMSNLIFMCLVSWDPGPKSQDPDCRSRDPANVYAPKHFNDYKLFSSAT